MVQKEGTEYLLCGLVTDVMTNVDVTFRGVDWPWFILNYPNQSQLIVINPQLPCGIGKTNCQESHCYFMKSNKTFWNSQSLLKGLHFWSSSVLLNVIVPHWCHFTVFLSTILTFRQCVLFFFYYLIRNITIDWLLEKNKATTVTSQRKRQSSPPQWIWRTNP